ncbi:MAG TPA: hypothetical protein VGF56_12000 [Rhizomicrobium sp.]|jgi:hypothetical protein
MRPRIALCLLAAAFAAPASADDCRLTQVASLDATWTPSGDFVVPISIEGKTKMVTIDVAGFKSGLRVSTIAELGLKHTAMNPNYRIQMVTNEAVTYEALAEPVGLGGLGIHRMKFLAAPDDTFPTGVDGTVSMDILGNYDVEIDPAHMKVNLFAQDHCPGQVVYWTKAPAAAIVMRSTEWEHTLFMADLDSHPVTTSLDTTSARSYVVYHQAAPVFGWKSGGDPVPNEALPGDTGDYSPLFKHLILNGVDITNPKIVIQKFPEGYTTGETIPLWLGMNILRKFRLFLSSKDHMIYLTAANAPPADKP